MGLPKFSIEKPILKPLIPRSIQSLLEMEKSGGWIADLKLNEHHVFVVIKDFQPQIWSYRGNKCIVHGPLLEQLRSMELPDCVIDGGHFRNLKVSKDSFLWVFNILSLDGERLNLPYKNRRKILDTLFPAGCKPNIWKSPQTRNFVEEFRGMLLGESELIRNWCEQNHLNQKVMTQFIEGLVIYNLSGKPSFPTIVKKVPSMQKLRLQDVLVPNRRFLLETSEERIKEWKENPQIVMEDWNARSSK